MDPELGLGQLRAALGAFVAWLSGSPASAEATVEDLARIYADVKSRDGREAVCARLGLQEAELSEFDVVLRDSARRAARLRTDGSEVERRNAEIAALRLLAWLETIAARATGFTFSATVGGRPDEIGRKQVRALELILRSLIAERYETQPALTARIKELLSQKAVEQFLAAADKDDILSGTTFSDLASLFVSTQEYPGYAPLFEDTPFLTLLKEKRTTIRAFLDDIRRIRNALAHNRRVSPLQLELLSLYYDELSEPLQEAFDHGRSRVNPEAFLDVSSDALREYFDRLSSDMRSVRDDISELRADLSGRLEDIKGDTEAIRETAARIEVATGSVGRRQRATLVAVGAVIVGLGVVGWLVFGQSRKTDDVIDASKRVESATGSIQQSTQRMEAVLGDIATGFARIDRNGGLIANPTRPEEHYHNALLYEQRGDTAQARAAYIAVAEAGVDAVDVLERLARLVRTLEGRSGAREALGALSKRTDSRSAQLLYAMQFEDSARTTRMQEFMAANPAYGPGYYLLAQEFSEERTGGQSLADKQREADLLKRFLDADAQGTLVAEFIDRQVLGAWLDRARERVGALKAQLDDGRVRPTMQASRRIESWLISFELPEAATRLAYRLGDAPDWTDNGVSDDVDLASGKPAPRATITLPPGQGATSIHLRYTNAKGDQMGPFEYRFDPQAALVSEHKEILETTWANWIRFSETDYIWGVEGPVVDFSHLYIWRCAIDKIQYSFDSDQLDRTLDLPPCDESRLMQLDQPKTLDAPAGLKAVYVRIRYKDGSQSPVREFLVPLVSAAERSRRIRELELGIKAKLESERDPWVWLRDRSDRQEVELNFWWLAENTCGIERAMYSFDGNDLDRVLALPSCPQRGRLKEDACVVVAPRGVQTVSVQLLYKDGAKSRVRQFELVKVLMPPKARKRTP